MSNLEVPQKRPARPQRSARRPKSASRTPSPAPSDLTPPSGSDGDPSESSESIEDTSNPPKNTFNVPLPSSYIPNRQSSLVRPEAQPPVPSRASSLTVQQQQEQERLRNRQSSQSQRSSSNKSTDKRSSSLWHTIQSLKRNTSHSQSQFSGVRKRNTLSLFNFPRKAFSSTNLRKPSMSSLPTSPATHFAVPQRFSSVAADNDQIPTINEHPMKDIHDDWEPIQAWLSTGKCGCSICATPNLRSLQSNHSRKRMNLWPNGSLFPRTLACFVPIGFPPRVSATTASLRRREQTLNIMSFKTLQDTPQKDMNQRF